MAHCYLHSFVGWKCVMQVLTFSTCTNNPSDLTGYTVLHRAVCLAWIVIIGVVEWSSLGCYCGRFLQDINEIRLRHGKQVYRYATKQKVTLQNVVRHFFTRPTRGQLFTRPTRGRLFTGMAPLHQTSKRLALHQTHKGPALRRNGSSSPDPQGVSSSPDP